jgi:aspartate/methionine/tyrosine aminotransferase
VDFNQYLGILNGAIAALASPPSQIEQMVDTFRSRRDVFVGALRASGWDVASPQAAMYVWAKLPEAWADRSVEFCVELVAATGVAVSPGAGFGKAGEGYVRFALVQEAEVLAESVRRMAGFLG